MSVCCICYRRKNVSYITCVLYIYICIYHGPMLAGGYKCALAVRTLDYDSCHN